jgi:hypothetical protein
LVELAVVTASPLEVAATLAPVVQDTPAKHTNKPVATINAERPLALIIIGNLPICPNPRSKRDCAACSQRGKKRESSGNTGRKQGKPASVGRALAPRRALAVRNANGPRGMRAARIDGMSLRVDGLSRDSSPDWLDHDFVIVAIRRNKLKD